MTDKITRSHGSTGTEPVDGDEFESGQRPDNEHFDWFWYTVTTKINGIIDDIADIVDGTTTVGDASFADAAGTATNVKGNDIDSDGDGKVNSADYADAAGDADTVDGEDASAFADVSHTHDGRYPRLFDGVQAPVYASQSDVPASISKGEMVYVDGDGLYVEDGS